MIETSKKLVRSESIRLGKQEIRDEINRALDEMPDGLYYEYSLKALTKEEYLQREKIKREQI